MVFMAAMEDNSVLLHAELDCAILAAGRAYAAETRLGFSGELPKLSAFSMRSTPPSPARDRSSTNPPGSDNGCAHARRRPGRAPRALVYNCAGGVLGFIPWRAFDVRSIALTLTHDLTHVCQREAQTVSWPVRWRTVVNAKIPQRLP